MARYVSIYKDLTRIDRKVLGPFTKRQLICVGIAAVIGLPLFWNTYKIIGSNAALWLMMAICFPILAFAAYKDKHGLPLEKKLYILLRMKLFPRIRVYKTHNFLANLQAIIHSEQEVKRIEHAKKPKTKSEKCRKTGSVRCDLKAAHKAAGLGHARRYTRKNP